MQIDQYFLCLAASIMLIDNELKRVVNKSRQIEGDFCYYSTMISLTQLHSDHS